MPYIEFNNNSQPAINDTNLNRMQDLIHQDVQGAVSGDTLPIGSIMPFGSDTIPENWLLCDGRAVSRTEYNDLFNNIGTSFGSGDGFTTFNLPNLKGKVPVGKDENDTDFDTLGNTGGEKTHTLTIDEMPSHSHNVYYKNNTQEVASGTSSVASSGSSTSTTSTGGNQPHNILQPYIVQNYIIKAKQSAGVVATVVDNLTSTSQTDALSANQGRVLNEQFNYSLTEQAVGTWIDGKTIYRKCFRLPLSSSNNNTDSIIPNSSINNLSEITFIRGILKNQFGNYFPLVSINPNGDINEGVGVYYHNTDGLKLRLGTVSVSSNSYAYFILEYTKQ